MLDVLLESKAVRTKRMGGTLTSVLVHGAIITGVIALGVRPTYVDARTSDFPESPTIYRIPVQPTPESSRSDASPSRLDHPIPPAHTWPLPRVDHIPPRIPPVHVNATPITHATEFTRRVSTQSGGNDARGLSG